MISAVPGTDLTCR